MPFPLLAAAATTGSTVAGGAAGGGILASIGGLLSGGASLAGALSGSGKGLRTKHLTMQLNVADTQHGREIALARELGQLQLAIQHEASTKALDLQSARDKAMLASVETPVGKASVGGGLILVAGLAVFLIFRKRRKKK